MTKNCLQTRQYFSASNSALYRVGAHYSWKEQINFYKLCNIPFTNFHCDFMLGNQILFLNIVLHKHKSRIENSFSKYSVTNLYTKTKGPALSICCFLYFQLLMVTKSGERTVIQQAPLFPCPTERKPMLLRTQKLSKLTVASPFPPHLPSKSPHCKKETMQIASGCAASSIWPRELEKATPPLLTSLDLSVRRHRPQSKTKAVVCTSCSDQQ